MKWILLTAVLLPCYVVAQGVKPVLSDDYRSLVVQQRDSLQQLFIDSSNDVRNAAVLIRRPYYIGTAIQLVNRTGKGLVTFKQPYSKTITVGGSYALSWEGQASNRSNAVQQEYVQGRAIDGKTRWQGPETGELFSYGPPRQTLQYDGVPYAYDRRGRLVDATSTNGTPVMANDNRVLHTGNRLSQALAIRTRYKVNNYPVASMGIRFNQDEVQTIVRKNSNRALQLAVDAELKIKATTFKTNLDGANLSIAYPDRAGLLNRAYKNSLLAPVDFDSRQGLRLLDGQRAWSPAADNAYFLLDNPEHGLAQRERSGSFSIEQRFLKYRGSINLVHSFHRLDQHSNEGFEKGTAFFTDGLPADRVSGNREQHSRLTTSVNYLRISTHLRGSASLQWWHSDTRSLITTGTGNAYRYTRSTNRANEDFSLQYTSRNYNGTVTLSNTSYGSSTANKTRWVLPAVSMSHQFGNIRKRNTLILHAGYSQYVSELPLTRSYAVSTLLQYTVAQAGEWFPRYEVNGFKGLSFIHHREWSLGGEYNLHTRYGVQANWSTRRTGNDVFPIVGMDAIQLINLATHRYQTLELEVRATLVKTAKWDWNSVVGWTKNFSCVLFTTNGAGATAIAGFKDVYKAVVPGQPLGVLMGSTWRRDAAGNRVIGADGFPLVNERPGIIGNPLPAFVATWSNQLTWKKITASLDMEWNCGGDMWNGTQAVLDYYGRSATSGRLRSITGYVFPGVTENGEVNSKPVSFYDPALPLEQNRWVRYGVGGVAEAYIRDASTVRIERLSIYWKKPITKTSGTITLGMYVGNLLLWSASSMAGSTQLLFDYPGTNGLDYFNLPSSCSFGITTSIQF